MNPWTFHIELQTLFLKEFPSNLVGSHVLVMPLGVFDSPCKPHP